MSLFLRQLRNELVKMFARKRTWLGFAGSFAAEFLFLLLWRLPLGRRVLEGAFRRSLAGQDAAVAEYNQGLTAALMTLSFTFLLLGGLYLALVCGDIMSKEVEDGTMRMLLARPISRRRVWLLKWLAASCYTVTLVIFIAASSLGLATAMGGGLGKLAVMYGQHPRHLMLISTYDTWPGLIQYGKAVLLLAVVMHVVSALAFLFSCLNMKPATATIATLAVFFLDAVLKMVPFFHVYEEWLISYHLACWLRSFSRLVPTAEIVGSVTYLLILAAIFLGIGLRRFSRRDFKS